MLWGHRFEVIQPWECDSYLLEQLSPSRKQQREHLHLDDTKHHHCGSSTMEHLAYMPPTKMNRQYLIPTTKRLKKEKFTTHVCTHQDWLVYCGMSFNNAWEIWWEKIPLPIYWNVTSWPRRSPVLPVLLQDLQSSRPSSHSWNMRSSGSMWHWIPHLLLAGLVAKTWIQVEVKLQEHGISAKQDKEIPCPLQAISNHHTHHTHHTHPPIPWPSSP